MHLTFPDRSDRFSREELRCLAVALGFHKDIFSRHVPACPPYVETKVLLHLVNKKVFNHDLHETHNMHDGVYNAKVLEKAIHVLTKRLFTFSELKTIRIAFEVYECQDLSGMEVSPHTILRTLKMCGRVISPRKLIHCIKHMPRDITDRLALHDFIELVPMCERIQDVKIRLQRQAEVKRRRRSNESELADFKEILVQEEKKQIDFLDDDYEQSFFRPAFEDKPTWRIPPDDAINNKEWMKHTLAYRQVASGLDVTVGYTNRKVVRARTGTPGQYITFGDQKFSSSVWDHSRKPVGVPKISSRLKKSVEDPGHHIHGTINNSRQLVKPPADCTRQLMHKTRQHCWSEPTKEFSRKSKMTDDSSLVTQEALQETNTKIVNLLWDLEMKDTLLKIRSREQAPKSIRKVYTRGGKGEIPGVETHRLLEFDLERPQKNVQKVSTISSRRSPTSASELYTFLTRRSKTRDDLLSPAGFRT